MSETKFDWDDLRLFLAVARHGGLAAAATETEKSAPTLGRRILALERRLNQELFVRSSRGYTLTQQGQTLYSTAADLEADIQPILFSSSNEAAPRVKISAGSWVTHHLCKRVETLVADNWRPVLFISANHALNLTHREAAIGIRNARPNQANLAGQPLKTVQFAIYSANPDNQNWVRVVADTPSAHWVLKHTDAEHDSANCFEVTDPRNALDLLHSSAVRAVLPTFIGDAEAGLKKISDDIPELEHQQWLVTHHEDRHRQEVRQVINWLCDELGNEDILR